MNARLNAFIVPDLLLTQPPLSSPTSYPTCCSRSYQFHRTRPAAHAATLINTRTQPLPAAAAMDIVTTTGTLPDLVLTQQHLNTQAIGVGAVADPNILEDP